uniref:Uncharacterized protein n=1 Tax=Anopheles aquasalis TaxID=42839 RepID=T1DR24_ANOAQ
MLKTTNRDGLSAVCFTWFSSLWSVISRYCSKVLILKKRKIKDGWVVWVCVDYLILFAQRYTLSLLYKVFVGWNPIARTSTLRLPISMVELYSTVN